MVLQSLTIKNFRSIFDETLECEALTALVGANGSGKSSFLRALDLFYNPAAKVDRDDFYNRETTSEIVISLTFAELSTEAKELFQKYIQADTLTVERIFKWEDEKAVAKYHGSTLQNPAFAHIKEELELKDSGKQAKESYKKIKIEAKYSSLPETKTKGDILEALHIWEETNNKDCVRERDDGQFFGFQSVAEGYLGKFTKFLFIPAIREASDDASENKGSAINVLMDLVVRSVLANKEEIKNLKQDTQIEYEKIMAPANLGELTILGNALTKTLKTFAPDASVDLLWKPLDQVTIPMPQADVRLAEDGYSSTVSRTGHGLQRAFILTMLQHLALAQATMRNIVNKKTNGETEEEQSSKTPNFLIAIEEPELYQHPNRQRHLASILMKLTGGEIPGVAEHTQVLYCTHSPLFIGIDRIDQVRLLRKVTNDPAKPKISQITSTKLSLIASELDVLDGNKGLYTATTLIPRLQSIMTPMMNEGFFAKTIALVEGDDDRAAIIGMAKSLGCDLDGMGFAIISAGGKSSMDRPYLIFKKLGIPVYPIWDSDYGKADADPETNKRMLRLLNESEEEWPNFVHDNCACFKNDLESTLKQELGQTIFDTCVGQCKIDFGMAKEKQIKKNPNFYKKLIDDASIQKIESATLKKITETIINLK